MKAILTFFLFLWFCAAYSGVQAQTSEKQKTNTGEHLFIDVHHLPAGSVKFDDVAAAHAKDLKVEKKHGVHFHKYWVDEPKGIIYCLSSAPDSTSIVKTHSEAHGLLPQQIYEVTDGIQGLPAASGTYFLDIHDLGAGNVKASDVAIAHNKDLAVQGKYGVNFINYWVDEKRGLIVCLSQATDSSKVIQTHQEAHGLLPRTIMPVKQGE